MAQETRIVDYESMVNKYINEWEGCNLREFCFSEKVNIYRMLKAMKKMGVTKDPVPHGLKPLEFSETRNTDDVEGANDFYDDGCFHNVHSYKGDLADLLANKWKPSEAALVPILV